MTLWTAIDENLKVVTRGSGRPPLKGDLLIIGDGNVVTHEVIGRAWRPGDSSDNRYPEATCDVLVVVVPDETEKG